MLASADCLVLWAQWSLHGCSQVKPSLRLGRKGGKQRRSTCAQPQNAFKYYLDMIHYNHQS